MKQFLKFILKKNSIISSSRDTGYRVYEKYFNKIKSECVQPVFNRFVKVRPAYLRLLLGIKKNSYSKRGFKDLGYPDVLSRGWDEFLWQEKPFGFHLQGAKKEGGIIDHASDMSYLREILQYFLKK